MKFMKRLLPLALVLALALTACGKKEGSNAAAKTPEEYAAAYSDAIQAARDSEANEYNPVVTNVSGFVDEVEEEMVFALLGFTAEDTQAYGLSLSLMNVNAYAIAAVKPAEGKEETVKTGLEKYIESQKASFENYLEDQLAIASAAKLETLDDGTVLLVMCEGQDTVFDSIKTALAQ